MDLYGNGQTFNPPPFLGFNDPFESQQHYEPKPELSSLSVVPPKPLECLHEVPVPPFLSKTYDLVDDPSSDPILSWGAKGQSFVVWEPVEFARIVLPRNFKHNNFSSFVRQLNTYVAIPACASQGFRKIDADKWEFMNEGFIKGHKDMLKSIQRRKSPHSQQNRTNEAGKAAALEGELEHLRKERSSMMQELVELQNQQRGNVEHMGKVNDRLEAAEKRQKQMVSFLGNMFKNPKVLASLARTREQKSLTSAKSPRKFIKHQHHGRGTSGLSPKRQIVKHQHAPCNYTTPLSHAVAEQVPTCPLQEMDESPYLDPFQVEDTPQDGLAMANYHLPDPPEQKDMAMDKGISDFTMLGTASFESGSCTSSSTTPLWGNVGVADLGVDNGLSDIWDISSLPLAGNSGIEMWPDEELPF